MSRKPSEPNLDGKTHVLGRSVHGHSACGRMARDAVFVSTGERPTCATCWAMLVRREERDER